MSTNDTPNESVRNVPMQFANVSPGDVVVELGSGTGNNCFMARTDVGEAGRVIGLSATPAHLEQARLTAERIGYTNVEFVQSQPQAIPLPGGVADVVVSNDMADLAIDRQTVLDELYRILKPGGRFYSTDVLLTGAWPIDLREAIQQHTAGAIEEYLYLDLMAMAGFENVTFPKRDAIHLPNDLLKTYLTDTELTTFRAGGGGLFSIIACAEKLATDALHLSAADLSTPITSKPDEDDTDEDDLDQYDFLGRL